LNSFASKVRGARLNIQNLGGCQGVWLDGAWERAGFQDEIDGQFSATCAKIEVSASALTRMTDFDFMGSKGFFLGCPSVPRMRPLC
jgi:hypothetical protein